VYSVGFYYLYIMGKQFTTTEQKNTEENFNELTEKLLFSTRNSSLSDILSGKMPIFNESEYENHKKEQEELEKSLDNALKEAKPCPFCNNTENLNFTYKESRGHGDSGFEKLSVTCPCGASKNSKISDYGAPSIAQKLEAIKVWNTRIKQE